MKRFIWFGLGIIFLLLIAGSTLYVFARASLAEDVKRVATIVLQEEDVQSVMDVDYYHGKEVVYSAIVQTDQNELERLFVRDEQVVTRISLEETLTEEEAMSLVRGRFQIDDIKSIHAGIENGTPLYQLTFEKDNRLHFYYLDMRDGTFIKRYSMMMD